MTVTGGEKLQEYLGKLGERLSTSKIVRVGILEGATYPPRDRGEKSSKRKEAKEAKESPIINTAMVAAVHEFGTKNVPERPFMRTAINKKQSEWAAAIANGLKNGGKEEEVLQIVGALAAADMKNTIVAGGFKPLAQETIDRKGFSTQLIETAHLKNSIDFQVVDK